MKLLELLRARLNDIVINGSFALQSINDQFMIVIIMVLNGPTKCKIARTSAQHGGGPYRLKSRIGHLLRITRQRIRNIILSASFVFDCEIERRLAQLANVQ